MRVPFLDLKSQYAALKDEISPALNEVLENTAFAGGPFVSRFEEDFAAYCERDHAIAVNSGTTALWLALLALGVGPGDEVITVPNTFIATAEAISYTGATPVFVDIDETTYNMNPSLLETAITPKTKAVIPVHLFGQPADMDPIIEMANRQGISVLEDSCQAHGAKYRAKRAGSIGNAGAFSFYPGKNLGAYGEGGAIVTNDSGLAAKVRRLRDHGQSKKYYHDEIGWNARMDGFQGAVLGVKLKHLDEWNERRRKNASLYGELLSDIESVTLPHNEDFSEHVFHLYVIRMENRDAVIDYLKEKEVFCGIHYPIPVHLQKAYAFLRLGEGSFPVAEKCASEFISLPMFPELNTDQIAYVADQLKAFVLTGL